LFAVQGGGYEFPVFWAIVCFALTLLGDGAHAFKPFRHLDLARQGRIKRPAGPRKADCQKLESMGPLTTAMNAPSPNVSQ
jgi:hypothetical protein